MVTVKAVGQALKRAGAATDVAAVLARLRGLAAAPAAADESGLAVLVEALGLDDDDDAFRATLGDFVATLRAGYTGEMTATSHKVRVIALRDALKTAALDGFIIPRNDEHQGEYVPIRAERLAWLTGFSGSAGVAIVLLEKAAIFVDGRYTLQLRNQADSRIFEFRHLIDEPAADWLAENAPKGGRIGFDAWLHTPEAVERLEKACAARRITLHPVDTNPVDEIWHHQPPPPLAPALVQDDSLAGETTRAKRRRIGKAIAARGADAVVITLPDSIAWLLNIRGGDVPRTPFPLSFLTLTSDGGTRLFIDSRKLAGAVREHLEEAAEICSPDEFPAALQALRAQGTTVLLDRATVPGAVVQALGGEGQDHF